MLGDITELKVNKSEKNKAKDIAQYGIKTIRRDTSVYEAIATLVKNDISGLPVVDDTGLAGIITEKDILKLLYNSQFLPGNTEDYMTEDVVSFDEQDSLVDICNCLIERNFRRVPILHQGRLVAIISRSDLINANKDKFRPKNLQQCSTKRRTKFTAKDIMKCGLLTVKKHTPIFEAMETMSMRNVTGLPVVDDYLNLVGIITEKDMLKLLYDPQAKSCRVEELMTENVVSFNRNDSLFDVCDCLINNNFRRVPILDEGKLTGIISRADIIAYILKNKFDFFYQKSMA